MYRPSPAGPTDQRIFYHWVYQELQAVGAEIESVTGAGGNVPVGGNAGQVLIKNSATNGDYSWGDYSVSWNSISGRPSTFPPDAHTHLISQIIGLQTALDSKAQAGDNVSIFTNDAGYLTSVSWGIISGIPSTFPPDAHTHTLSEITDFNAADYATAAQGALADTALQPGDVVSAEQDNITFNLISGGVPRPSRFRLQRIVGGTPANSGDLVISGGDPATLMLAQPLRIAGGAP